MPLFTNSASTPSALSCDAQGAEKGTPELECAGTGSAHLAARHNLAAKLDLRRAIDNDHVEHGLANRHEGHGPEHGHKDADGGQVLGWLRVRRSP